MRFGNGEISRGHCTSIGAAEGIPGQNLVSSNEFWQWVGATGVNGDWFEAGLPARNFSQKKRRLIGNEQDTDIGIMEGQ